MMGLASVRASEKKAFDHLDKIYGQHHRSLNVFTDLGDAGNHFAARCALGGVSSVQFDETWTANCKSGDTCIKNSFTAGRFPGWGGWYFQVGVLNGAETAPQCNWGTVPGAGRKLTGASKLTFWARGQKGGERIEFFVGGIGRDAETGAPTEPHPDSTARVPGIGKVTKLTRRWRKYTIDLKGRDLSYIVGGFAWVASEDKNRKGATFYLDDIKFDKPKGKPLRFLESFANLRSDPGPNFDTILQNTAFTYDNTVVLLAYLARGTASDRKRAKMLANALVYAQQHDRHYTDGRIRNCYQAGDLVIAPGWHPNGTVNSARLPGWWDPIAEEWVEIEDCVGTSSGNVGWAMIALLRAYEVLGKRRYLRAARRLGDWIERNTVDMTVGYRGGFQGWEPSPTRLTWKSTEHNIDLYAAFMKIFDITRDPVSRQRARHARKFVISMWEACGPSHFATGTTDDGETPNCDFAPGDVNTWGLMALGKPKQYGAGVRWVMSRTTTVQRCGKGLKLKGTDFNDDTDGVWLEGTAHTAIAQQILDKKKSSQALLKTIVRAQKSARHTDGLGIVATCRQPITTGIDGFKFFNRLHIAATAWYALALQRANPFWGVSTDDPIPHGRD